LLGIWIWEPVLFTPWMHIRDEFFPDPGSFWLWISLLLKAWEARQIKFAFPFLCRIWELGSGMKKYLDPDLG
jgi:hypothetical protein